MVIDFECNNCNGDFELEADEFIENPKPIKCPHCKAKVDTKASEDFATVLEDLIAQIAAMSKKFNLTMTLETDDLPGAAHDDEDDDSDADDDIDLDDEDLEADDVDDED